MATKMNFLKVQNETDATTLLSGGSVTVNGVEYTMGDNDILLAPETVDFEALETAVDILESRVDNIVANSSSTEGNAELIDIRVGANGITYASAGSAVRSQISELEGALFSPLNIQKLDSSCARYGFYILTDAWYLDNSGDERMVVFPVKSNSRYVVKKATATHMRVGSSPKAIPTAGTQCTNLVYHNTASSDSLEIQTGAADKYLYIELFIGSDSADLKNVDVHLSSLTVSELAFEKIDELKDDIYGELISFENGLYWSSNPVIGVNVSSIQPGNSNKLIRATVSLPKNSTLRIYGFGEYTELTRTYFVFDSQTNKLIDLADANKPSVAKPIYLSYNVDTTIYINIDKNYPNSVSIVNDYSSPFKEIADIQNSGENATDIITLNDKAYTAHALKSLNRRDNYKGGAKPLVLLHFSDIHGDSENLQRIVDFKNEYASYISGSICSGDIVDVTIEEGMEWWDKIDGSNQIMLTMGNHESAKMINGVDTYGVATKSEIYDLFIRTRINNWGVTQPTNADSEYLAYYYKDYLENGVRVVFLDFNHGDEYINKEITWFQGVLSDASNKNLSVVCVSHYPFLQTNNFNCSFSQVLKEGELNRWEIVDGQSWKIPSAFTNAVDSFISNGGKFVCWLSGHTHQDSIGVSANNENQMCISVSCASCSERNVIHSDDLRERNTKSQDLFNIISIDTVSKTLSILRIGSDLTRFMQQRKTLCVDYENKKVI